MEHMKHADMPKRNWARLNAGNAPTNTNHLQHVWSMQPSLTSLHAYNHVSITVAPMPNIGTSALHAKTPYAPSIRPVGLNAQNVAAQRSTALHPTAARHVSRSSPTPATRTAAPCMLRGGSRGKSKLLARMPAAKEHLFDNVRVTGIELYM